MGVYRPSHLKELHCCSTLTFNDQWWQVVSSHCSQGIIRTLVRRGGYAAYHFSCPHTYPTYRLYVGVLTLPTNAKLVT